MNPLEQRIAIAESVGWTVYHRNDKGEIKSWKSPDGSIWQEPWTPLRFTEDLNAMHEVERNMTDLQKIQFTDILYNKVGRELLDWTGCYYPGELPTIDLMVIFETLHTSAAQRAEAYLRTIGKWKD